MSIHYHVETTPRDATDPYNYIEAGPVLAESFACFARFWGTPARQSDCVRLRVLITAGITHDMLVLYVRWLRGLRYDARIVQVLNVETIDGYVNLDWNGKGVNKRKTSIGNRYLIELQWMGDAPASFIFVGLNLIRFLTEEFVNPDKLGNVRTLLDLFNAVLPTHIRIDSHYPLRDVSGHVFHKRSTELHAIPDFSFARATLAFYSDYVHNNRWHIPNLLMSERGAAMLSNITFDEMYEFCKVHGVRLSEYVILETSIEQKEAAHVETIINVRKRPRDSSGRFIRVKA